MRVATWNMGHRRDAWDRLLELDVDVALVQEAPPPPRDLPGQLHLAQFSSGRTWATGVWSRSRPLQPLPATTSESAPPWREGIAAVAAVGLENGGTLTAISVHAVDDKHRFSTVAQPRGYAVTTAHHALSDLTGYLDDRARHGTSRGGSANRLLLGGDFNINPGWDERQRNRSHQLVLDRIVNFGLTSALEIRSDDVNATCVRGRIPYRQIDYLFGSGAASISDGTIVDSQALRRIADHLPITATIAGG